MNQGILFNVRLYVARGKWSKYMKIIVVTDETGIFVSNNSTV